MSVGYVLQRVSRFLVQFRFILTLKYIYQSQCNRACMYLYYLNKLASLFRLWSAWPWEKFRVAKAIPSKQCRGSPGTYTHTHITWPPRWVVKSSAYDALRLPFKGGEAAGIICHYPVVRALWRPAQTFAGECFEARGRPDRFDTGW